MKTWEKISAALAMAVTLAVFGAGLMGCGPGPVVVQGTVISYDTDAKDLVVKDERGERPEIEISLTNAEIGAEPVAGDTVRVAYKVEGAENRGIRVMNISRQAELRGRGEGGH